MIEESENDLDKRIELIKNNKPTFPISTPHKLGVGLLSLVFSIATAFVYVEERQRGVALLVSIPLAICIIYFFYLWMKDNESLKIYKLYRDDLYYLIKQKKPEFVPKKEKVLLGDIGTIKAITGFLAVLVMAISIAMHAEKIRIASTFSLLFIVLLIAFVLVVDYEGKTIVGEIDAIEKEISLSVDGKPQTTIQKDGATEQ